MTYNKSAIDAFISFINENDGITDKDALSKKAQIKFQLTQDRSVFYGQDYAVRFCKSNKKTFSNTILSLSSLQKYDKYPFIVCLVTPSENYLMLANTTFLKKISHSSQELSLNNIKGSFNGSDILRNFEGIENESKNFEFLFTSHENYTFTENLERLVEATNNILPIKNKFQPTKMQFDYIIESVDRAISFISSNEYKILNQDLQKRVNQVSTAITIAAFIENINLRGRIIEYLVTSSEGKGKSSLIDALLSKKPLPPIFTADKLGDYEYIFDNYNTATDIKTKILFLSSNPKGYNIDKLLSFLSDRNSVYLIYIIAIDEKRNISTRLCSMYNKQLLNGTRIIKHWAGRNSRGVTQYDGIALKNIISDFDFTIDPTTSKNFILKLLDE